MHHPQSTANILSQPKASGKPVFQVYFAYLSSSQGVISLTLEHYQNNIICLLAISHLPKIVILIAKKKSLVRNLRGNSGKLEVHRKLIKAWAYSSGSLWFLIKKIKG